MKKKTRGGPRFRKEIDEIKKFNKNRKKKGYRPGPDYPTVEEAKILLRGIYARRGYKVSGVRINCEGFTVCFAESKKTFKWSESKKGGGPYGLGRLQFTWYRVKQIYQKEMKK